MPRGRPARRLYFFKGVAAARNGDDGLADAWRAKRLAEPGTALPAAFPWRAQALAVGVLAIEDLDGASTRAMEALGLTHRQATDIFNRIEGITVITQYFQSGPRAGEPYEQDDVTLVATGERSASFNTDPYEVGDKGTLRLSLTIGAISGAGAQLQVQLETRASADDTWRTVDAFSVQTATGTARKTFAGLDRFVRAVCSIAGATPSVTFSLAGEAV